MAWVAPSPPLPRTGLWSSAPAGLGAPACLSALAPAQPRATERGESGAVGRRGESGRGLPHSKTLRARRGRWSAAGQNYTILSEKGVSASKLTNLFQVIQDSEYDIGWKPTVGAYQSPNRAQNLRFTYYANGFSAQRRDPIDAVDTWQVTFALQALGPGESISLVNNPTVELGQRRARFGLPEVTFEYTNSPAGMRQTFIVDKRPRSGTLTLELAMTLGGVSMAMDGSGSCVSFARNTDGTEVMRYNDLKAWDAQGRILPARMQVAAPDRIVLAVDDRHATYPVTVDPLALAWEVDGTKANAQLGFSVGSTHRVPPQAGVGPGVIIGAPYYENSQPEEGAVFVFCRSLTGGLPATPTWTAYGAQAYGHLGWAVAAGDVDGDGYADIIVGAPDYTLAGVQGGAVFLWKGGANGIAGGETGTPANAAWQHGGSQYGDAFGYSVTAADVNGDGVKDIVVGAPYYARDDRGAALVFEGHFLGVPNASPDWFQQGNSESLFGFAVGTVGSLNDPVAEDVIIGAPSPGSVGAGFVYAGVSGSGLQSSPTTTLSGSTQGSQFGFSVAGAGDEDGDGFPDVVVGAPNGGTSQEGAFYLYLSIWDGSRYRISASSAFSDRGGQSSAHLGYSVGGGDLDNDGASDLVVGAPGYPVGGAWYVYWGVAGGVPNPSQRSGFWEAIHTGSEYGAAVAFAEDIQYGGVHAFLVGAPAYPIIYTSIPAGKVEAWKYSSSLTATGLGRGGVQPRD